MNDLLVNTKNKNVPEVSNLRDKEANILKTVSTLSSVMIALGQAILYYKVSNLHDNEANISSVSSGHSTSVILWTSCLPVKYNSADE